MKNFTLYPPKRVQTLRIYLRLSVPAFAASFPVSRQAIYNWETGRSQPTMAHQVVMDDLQQSLPGQQQMVLNAIGERHYKEQAGI